MRRDHRIATKSLLCAAAFAALAATGCADAGDFAEEADVTEAAEVASKEQGLVADTLTFTNVSANGSGCPLGTATTSISPDGLVFTTSFSDYVIDFNEKRSVVPVKTCQLNIEVNSPPGISYAVSEFSYQGYATLQSGSSARLSATYYFQGAPTFPANPAKNITGPYDNSYLFVDTIKTTDVVSGLWSPCGAKRALQIRTNLSVTNTSPSAGYINVASIDGKTEGKVVVKFAQRKCSK